MNLEMRSDQELLVSARRDPEAFAVLYRRHVNALLRYFRRRGLRPDQCLDLTGETFAAALESLDRYQPGSEPGAAWLYGIARNLLAQSARHGRVVDEARRRIGMEPVLVDDGGIAAIEELTNAEGERDLLHEALAALPEHQRVAIEARLIDDRDYSDIAEELAVSEQLVRQNVSRGLRRLRKTLLGDQA